MRRRVLTAALLIFIIPVLVIPALLAPAGYTAIELSDTGTGSILLFTILPDGEQAVLTWHNSLFGQVVTETFEAHNGRLVQTSVRFDDPHDPYQMPVTPRDVEDLYHTGGPFSAEGLARPFERIVFRISEIGDPQFSVDGRTVKFKTAVGFGGRILLSTSRPNLYQHFKAYLTSSR